MQYPLAWDFALNYTLGFLVFVVMLKFLRLLRFNKRVTELSSTLRYKKGQNIVYRTYFFGS